MLCGSSITGEPTGADPRLSGVVRTKPESFPLCERGWFKLPFGLKKRAQTPKAMFRVGRRVRSSETTACVLKSARRVGGSSRHWGRNNGSLLRASDLRQLGRVPETPLTRYLFAAQSGQLFQHLGLRRLNVEQALPFDEQEVIELLV
jgi:hypothetical protein